MSYVEKHLIEGETIIYETRLHWIVLIGPVLLGLLFGLTGVGMFVLSGRTTANKGRHPPSIDRSGSGLSGRRAHFYRSGRPGEERDGNDGDQQARFCKSWTGRAKNHRAPAVESGEHRR